MKRKNQYQKHYKKPDKKEIKKNMAPVKRCPHCGREMRPRGASDVCGGLSWKCKNKQCGRRVWERGEVRPPTPVVPVSYSSAGNLP